MINRPLFFYLGTWQSGIPNIKATEERIFLNNPGFIFYKLFSHQLIVLHCVLSSCIPSEGSGIPRTGMPPNSPGNSVHAQTSLL
jgi:hypothetical protein